MGPLDYLRGHGKEGGAFTGQFLQTHAVARVGISQSCRCRVMGEHVGGRRHWVLTVSVVKCLHWFLCISTRDIYMTAKVVCFIFISTGLQYIMFTLLSWLGFFKNWKKERLSSKWLRRSRVEAAGWPHRALRILRRPISLSVATLDRLSSFLRQSTHITECGEWGIKYRVGSWVLQLGCLGQTKYYLKLCLFWEKARKQILNNVLIHA